MSLYKLLQNALFSLISKLSDPWKFSLPMLATTFFFSPVSFERDGSCS